jgi:hypothetical protein
MEKEEQPVMLSDLFSNIRTFVVENREQKHQSLSYHVRAEVNSTVIRRPERIVTLYTQL